MIFHKGTILFLMARSTFILKQNLKIPVKIVRHSTSQTSPGGFIDSWRPSKQMKRLKKKMIFFNKIHRGAPSGKSFSQFHNQPSNFIPVGVNTILPPKMTFQHRSKSKRFVFFFFNSRHFRVTVELGSHELTTRQRQYKSRKKPWATRRTKVTTGLEECLYHPLPMFTLLTRHGGQ